MGIVSPVGTGVDQAWSNVVEGRSGITRIESIDTTGLSTQIAGTVKDFDVTDYLSAKEARKIDPFMHYGIVATQQAIADSGLEITPDNAHRIGIAMGAGIGGIGTIERNHSKYLAGGARKISPFFIPGSIKIYCKIGITGINILPEGKSRR